MKKKELGKLGEDIACKFFENNGIKIIKRNYFSKFGEIDLIGIENQTIIFIEVKLRIGDSFGDAIESINSNKLDKLHKSALAYLAENEIADMDCRFDVLSLLYSDINQSYKIDWLKNQIFY